jgi:hypothetical protein
MRLSANVAGPGTRRKFVLEAVLNWAATSKSPRFEHENVRYRGATWQPGWLP